MNRHPTAVPDIFQCFLWYPKRPVAIRDEQLVSIEKHFGLQQRTFLLTNVAAVDQAKLSLQPRETKHWENECTATRRNSFTQRSTHLLLLAHKIQLLASYQFISAVWLHKVRSTESVRSQAHSLSVKAPILRCTGVANKYVQETHHFRPSPGRHAHHLQSECSTEWMRP